MNNESTMYDKNGLSLIKAVKIRNIKTVSSLLDMGTDVNFRDIDLKTAIHHAVNINKEYIISRFTSKRKLSYDDDNSILLDTIKILNLLLSKGSMINIKDKYGRTPLHYATTLPCFVDIVNFLLMNGAEVNSLDKYNRSPLSNITNVPKRSEILGVIASYDIDIKLGDLYTKKFLYSCVELIEKVSTTLAYSIIEHDADVEVVDVYGKTPLFNSTKVTSMVEISKMLIDRGANVNVSYNQGILPIHNSSTLYNGSELINIMVSMGVDVNVRDKSRNTPLHYASGIRNGYYTVKTLIDLGAEVNAKDISGTSPLHKAVIVPDNCETVKLLGRNRADVNIYNAFGITPLHRAAAEINNLIMVKTLIDLGAKVNAKDNTGKSPLHYAANAYKYYQVPETIINECEISNTGNKINSHSSPYIFDCSEVIKLLVESGANVNSEDISKITPLHKASTTPYYNSIKALLDLGANVNAVDVFGKTALHHASNISLSSKNIDILLDGGSNVNSKDVFGKTPLHYAVNVHFKTNIVNNLISRGAMVNAYDYNGNTPLYFSIYAPEIVLILVRNGARINIVNKIDVTPLEISIEESIYSTQIMIPYFILESLRNPEIKNTQAFIKNNNIIEYNDTLKSIKTACHDEIKEMKNIHLNSKYYLDIFVISKDMNLLRRLVNYVKVDYLNQTMFPIYLHEIKKKIEMIRVRSERLETVLVLLDNLLIDGYWMLLPIEIKLLILSLLKDTDLSVILST